MPDNKGNQVKNAKDINEFMNSMDLALEPNLREVSDNKEQQKEEVKTETVPDSKETKDWKKEHDNLLKRYESSSKRGQELDEELKKYKNYDALLNMIATDEGLAKTIRNYVEGNTGSFNVPEDFEMDMEEAVKNPQSKSGQALGQFVHSYMKKELDNFKTEAKKEQERKEKDRAWKDFIRDENIDDDTADDFRNVWMKNTELDYKKLFMLYKLERGKTDAKPTETKETKSPGNNIIEQIEHLLKTSNIPPSLQATGETEEQEVPIEHQIFNQMKGHTSSIEDMLNTKK